MKPETPNEKNWRKLAERFKFDDRIVYDDGNEQFTLEMLREKTVMVKTVNQEDYGWKWLYGDEAILFMLKSDLNRIRNEITDVIHNLEMKIYDENRILTPREVEEMEKKFPFENENEPLYTIEIDYGNEQPLEMKFIDENGNEKVRKIEKMIGNGIKNRIIFANETGNGNENTIGNELRNELQNENENEQSIWKKIKNIL